MKATISITLALLTFVACARHAEEDVPEPETAASLSFVVTNYMQYDLDASTRAASATALDHLALGIFDAETGDAVLPLMTQDKADANYGTFSLRLPYGTYRLVFLGYNGTHLLSRLTATQVSFADDYVPHTFLCTKLLTVDEQTDANHPVVLRRAVAAFTLKLLDVVPSAVSAFRFASTNGGTVLNPQTALAATSEGRTSTVAVTDAMKQNAGGILNTYLYLPEEQCTTTYTISALDAKGNTLRQRTFRDVPLRINVKTLCQGAFFADDAFTCPVQYEEQWADTLHVSF